jgi:ribosomal protein L37AE/L43A
VIRISVNQCAQCRADIVAPEWSEHLSDYCIRHVWSCDACGYRFENTDYLSRESAWGRLTRFLRQTFPRPRPEEGPEPSAGIS